MMVLLRLFCFALVLLPSVAAAAAPTDRELINAAKTFVVAVLSRDTAGVLDRIGPSGITMGIDGDTIAKPVLVKDFARREGTFCDVFGCVGREGLGPIMRRLKLDRANVGRIKGRPREASVSFYEGKTVGSGTFGDVEIGLVFEGNKIYIVSVEYT